jgi:cobalt-zinc-cadmium efflux system outer membrane protein
MRLSALIGLALVLAVMGSSLPARAELLSFTRAGEMVLTEHPGLKALAEDLAAAEAAVDQARAFENPELEVMTEDFGRSEVEVGISLPVPLGGMRRAAIDVARREADIARLQLENERISVEAELTRRFVSVLAARERLAIVDSLAGLSAEGIEAVRRMVEAGAAMEVDLVRAELDGEELLLERSELELGLENEQIRLAELWGGTEFRFEDVSGSFDAAFDIPRLPDLATAMQEHPASRSAYAEVSLTQAEVGEARAERWPEVALSAGYLQNTEDDEGALLAGVAISLPIFDRKGSEIASREHYMAAAQRRADLDRLERTTALTTLHSEMGGTRDRLKALSGEMLAKAARIHADLQGFYSRGKTGILDVLEARGHLLEVRMRAIDLIEEQALIGADLMELTGYRIEVIE